MGAAEREGDRRGERMFRVVSRQRKAFGPTNGWPLLCEHSVRIPTSFEACIWDFNPKFPYVYDKKNKLLKRINLSLSQGTHFGRLGGVI